MQVFRILLLVVLWIVVAGFGMCAVSSGLLMIGAIGNGSEWQFAGVMLLVSLLVAGLSFVGARALWRSFKAHRERTTTP